MQMQNGQATDIKKQIKDTHAKYVQQNT